MLKLDHVIIRAADPAATLAALCDGTGLPILAPATRVGGMTSAIAQAGDVDIEILAIGDQPSADPAAYGLGFTAERPLDEAIRALRAAGLPVSAPVTAVAGEGDQRRRWRAAHVAGLLPDPFPVPTTVRSSAFRDRLSERVGSALARIPAVAKRATRDAGRSMVVITEYAFDADALRGATGDGPRVLEVHVGTRGFAAAWDRLPLTRPSPLRLDPDSPPGISRIVLAAPTRPADHACGDVTFELRTP